MCRYQRQLCAYLRLTRTDRLNQFLGVLLYYILWNITTFRTLRSAPLCLCLAPLLIGDGRALRIALRAWLSRLFHFQNGKT